MLTLPSAFFTSDDQLDLSFSLPSIPVEPRKDLMTESIVPRKDLNDCSRAWSDFVPYVGFVEPGQLLATSVQTLSYNSEFSDHVILHLYFLVFEYPERDLLIKSTVLILKTL